MEKLSHVSLIYAQVMLYTISPTDVATHCFQATLIQSFIVLSLIIASAQTSAFHRKHPFSGLPDGTIVSALCLGVSTVTLKKKNENLPCLVKKKKNVPINN